MKRKETIVSASEIGSWAWCAESWRLNASGEKPVNQAALEKGEATHAKTSAFEQQSRSATSLGWWLMAVAVVLALLGFVLVRG
jgi:hypothetical protein